MAEPPLAAPELLNAGHDVSRFSCGKPSLDQWLKTRALANQQKGFTVVMVVHVAGRVVGYYGLAPTAIDRPRHPASLGPHRPAAEPGAVHSARPTCHRSGVGRKGDRHRAVQPRARPQCQRRRADRRAGLGRERCR